MTTDEPTDEILQRVAPKNASAYIRAAVTEKAARDEYRSELDELRARVEALERAQNDETPPPPKE